MINYHVLVLYYCGKTRNCSCGAKATIYFRVGKTGTFSCTNMHCLVNNLVNICTKEHERENRG